jgi:L-cysteine desulfidase
MGVGIPGTDMIGLNIAAAIGAAGGDSNEKLEVLCTNKNNYSKVIIRDKHTNIVLVERNSEKN